MAHDSLFRKPWIPALCSALLALALYAVNLGGTYIYDDVGILHVDDRLTHPDQWNRYWYESYNQGIDNLYRPLVSMTYAAQWWLHGVDEKHAWAFHFVNWLMNAAVAALVAEFARRLTRRFDIAMIAGLLFAAHPLHVEAAAYIAGRAELMCGLGMVGAMVVMLRRPMTTRRAVAILALFILALLSKEQGMLLPLLLGMQNLVIHVRTDDRAARAEAEPRAETGAIIEYAPSHVLRPVDRERRAYLLLAMLLMWTLAGYIVLRENILKFWWDRSFLDWTINPIILSHGRDRALMPLVLLGRYTQLLIFPWRLSPDYGGNVIGSIVDLNDRYLYVGVAAVLAWLSLAVFATLNRRGVMLFLLLALALTYGVIGNIVTIIGTNFGERLMYLPSAFFLILVTMLLAKLPRRAILVTVPILVAVASVRTVTYARRWNDRLTFYQQSLKEQPHSIRLYMLLADEYRSRGMYDKAEEVIARGRDELPNYTEVWIHSAAIALAEGKYDQADEFIERSLKIKPTLKALGWKQKIEKERAAASQPARRR